MQITLVIYGDFKNLSFGSKIAIQSAIIRITMEINATNTSSSSKNDE